MMATTVVDMKDSFASENDLLAAKLKVQFKEQGVFVVNILGTAGAGKTTFLIGLLEALHARKSYVIEGDIASNIDTDTLRRIGIDAYQINTGGTCHLNAAMVGGILGRMRIEGPALLAIENIGNLICPVEYDIGENVRLVVSSVPEGSDKPYKYPAVFQTAGAVVVTKTDLVPYVDFDLDYFTAGVRSLNPAAPIFQVTKKDTAGFAAVADWLRARVQETYPTHGIA